MQAELQEFKDGYETVRSRLAGYDAAIRQHELAETRLRQLVDEKDTELKQKTTQVRVVTSSESLRNEEATSSFSILWVEQ